MTRRGSRGCRTFLAACGLYAVLFVAGAPGSDRVADAMRPEPLVKAETYYKENLAGILDGVDPGQTDIHAPEFKATREKIIELYRQGGFESVKEMAKSGDIPEAASKIIADVRNSMVNEAIAVMAGAFGEVRVNDFSTAPTAQSDIDQTFHPVMEPDPDNPGQMRVANHPEDGTPLTGAAVREQFNKIYEQIFKIDPERMEVSSHAAEATLPDWRQSPDFDDFAVRLARGAEMLMANPEAYFLEGAFRRQVDRRSFESDTPLFRIYRPLRKYDTIAQVLHVRPQVDVTRSRARIEVFRDVPPEWRKGYAFGACVGNLLFFQHHNQPGEVAERAKYLMRSMEDGMASMTLEGDDPGKLYFELGDADRREMLRKAYPDADADKLRHVYLMYETAEAIRQNRNNMSDPAVKEKALRYAMLQVLMEKELLDKPSEAVRRLNELDGAGRAGLMKDAEAYFQRASHSLLVENTVKSATARVGDWLDPARIDPDKLPKAFRDAFRNDPDTFRKNLKLAAASEIVDAFTRLDPRVVNEIIRREPNAEYREKLSGMKEAADLRRRLFGSHDAEHLDHVGDMARHVGDQLVRRHGELADTWRGGEYDAPSDFTRMKSAVRDELGHYREPELQRLDGASRAADPRWDTGKLAGYVFDVGNVDSVISIIRAGQVSDWDWASVGWAAGMELLSNIDGVAPVFAGYSAVVHGEFEGVAVMTAAYFVPAAGQIYTVYNIAKGTIEIIDFELERGISGMVYQGYKPPESGGFWGVVNTYNPLNAPTALASKFAKNQAPTVLHFVPGDTFNARRKNLFSHYDARVLGGAVTAGMSKEQADKLRQERAGAFFKKLVEDYCGQQGDFADVYIPGGSMFQAYLKRPNVRAGLVKHAVEDYLCGVAGQRMKGYQEETLPQMRRDADRALSLLDRLHAAHKQLGKQAKALLPVASGLPDFPDWTHKDIDTWKPWVAVDEQSEPVIRIEAPEGVLVPGDLQRLRATCATPPGRFRKPFAYQWEIQGLNAVRGPEEKRLGLTFSKGWTEARSATVKVTVKDANDKLIGSQTREIRFGELPRTETGRLATFTLMRVTVTSYSSKGKRRGDKLDVITETSWIPMLVNDERPFDKAVAQCRETLQRRHGPPGGTADWRGQLSRYGKDVVCTGWTLEAENRRFKVPFKPSDVPAKKREVKAGAGPQL
jgi:hypothetical protein